jgi:ABC-type nitrate/sulfonate/bicarbonate transport system substrate-binding protein
MTRFLHTMRRLHRGLALALALCLAGLGVQVRAAPMTLAIADLPAFSLAQVAEAKGYFAAQGLDLKIIHCVNGKRCLQHMLDGEAQYATVADTPIVLAILGGAQFDILGTIGSSPRENRFIARADRGIRTAADLKGKRVGIIKGTSVHYFSDTVLLFNGIATSQVTLVAVDGSDAPGALIRGDVDAMGLYSPLWQKAQAGLGVNAVTIPNPAIFTLTLNLVGTKLAAGGRDEDAIKILRALDLADQFMNKEPVIAQALVAENLNMPLAQLQAIWGDYDFGLSFAQPLITALEAQTRWAIREKMVPGATMPDYLDYIRLEPLRSVNKRLVTIAK